MLLGRLAAQLAEVAHQTNGRLHGLELRTGRCEGPNIFCKLCVVHFCSDHALSNMGRVFGIAIRCVAYQCIKSARDIDSTLIDGKGFPFRVGEVGRVAENGRRHKQCNTR